jgi:hypothetical protein
MLGNQRLGTFRQLRAQSIELSQFLQEGLVVVDAKRERHARGADIGRVREDFRDRTARASAQ